MSSLGDEIQVRITGDVATLTAATKTGAADLGVLEGAADKAGKAIKDAGTKVDGAAAEIVNSLQKVETESRQAGTALEAVGRGAQLPALAGPLDQAAGAARNLGEGTQLASWQVQNLGYQVNDVVTGLISGQRPMTVFLQQGLQMTQIFGSGATLSGALTAVGSSAMSMINPLTLAIVALGAVATAVEYVWTAWGSGSEKTKEDIKQHAALIDEIKRRWGDSAKAIEAYGETSAEVLRFRARQDVDAMAKALVAQASTAFKGIDDQVRQQEDAAKEINRLNQVMTQFQTPGMAIANVQVPSWMGEMRAAIDDLKTSMEAGNPDFVAFQTQIAKIANDPGASKEVRELAQRLFDASDAAAAAQQRFDQATASVKMLGGQAMASSAQVAMLSAALSQLRTLSAPQLDTMDKIDAAEKTGLATATDKGERDDITSLAAAARKNQIYDETTKTIQQMDVAMQAAGKTEAEIAQANLDAWRKSQEAAAGVAGVEEKVNDATARAKLAVINQTEHEAQDAAQQRIALVEAQEISSIDKLKAKRQELADLQGSLTGDRAKSNADELALIDQQLASAEIRISLDTEKAKIASFKAGSAERIAAQKEYLDKVKAQYGAESAEAIAAQRELNAAMVPRGGGGAGAGSAELANARRISQEKLRQTEYELDQEVRAGRMTEIQKVETLRQLTQSAYDEAQKQLDNELNRLSEGSRAWQKASQEKQLLKQQEATAMARLDDQMARASERAAQQSARAWESATDPMVSSFTGGLRSMISGQETFKNASLRAIGDILLAEMESDIKAFAHHALYAALGIKTDQNAAQGGILWMLFSQGQKTAATAAGSTVRASLEAGENIAASGAKTGEVAVHLAGEAAKTSATAVGAATRTSIDVGAGAAAAAANAATMKGGIFNHAASAAAATFDAVAQIPLVGYILAPAAAAVAFAGTAAFGSLLSFDVGAWNLPTDTIARVHKGETIVPATFADGLRSALTGQASAGQANAQPAMQGDTHFHFHGAVMDATSIAKAVTRKQNANPSMKPAYK